MNAWTGLSGSGNAKTLNYIISIREVYDTVGGILSYGSGFIFNLYFLNSWGDQLLALYWSRIRTLLSTIIIVIPIFPPDGRV